MAAAGRAERGLRVLYLAPDPVPAPKGAAVRIGHTVAALRGLGEEVLLFTPAAEPPPLPGHERVEIAGTNYLRRMLGWRAAAAGWLRGRRAELVQFRSIWEGRPALAWARGQGVPAVWELHGLPSIELPFHYPALAGHPGLLDKLAAEERALLPAVDQVLVPSETSARFARRLGARNVAVVANSVDPDLFSPGEPPPAEAPLRLVYQGTLAPWQGLSVVLEALALGRLGAQVELHVLGPAKSAWRARVRRLARQLRVHHALHLSPPVAQADLVPALRTAHACLAPLPGDPRNALQGCCPLKILEYMAVGRPILSTRIAPVEELLAHGRSAHLVEPGSAFATAAGLRWLLEHPREREALGRAARAEALSRFTPAHFRERLGKSRGLLGAAVL